MIASLALAAPALGAEPWSEPRDIGGSARAVHPAVGFYPNGSGVVLGQGRGERERRDGMIAARLRPGAVGHARPFGRTFLGDWRAFFDVALSGRDGLAAVRISRRGRLAVALGQAGREFGRARTFRTRRARDARVRGNEDGDVAAVFRDGRALFLAYREGGRRFERPVRLGPADAPTSRSAVAINRRGDTLVVWEARYGRPRSGRGSPHGVYARVRRANGRLEPLQRLGESGLFLTIRVAFDDSRRALAAWSDLWTVNAAHAMPGRRFSAPQLLEELGDTTFEGGNLEVQVALSPDGAGVVAWSGIPGLHRPPGARTDVRVSDVDIGRGVLPPEVLSPAGVPSTLDDMAVGPHGETLVLWTARPNAPDGYYAASARPPGAAAFGGSEVITAREWVGPVAAINPVTRVPVAVWVGSGGGLRYATRAPVGP